MKLEEVIQNRLNSEESAYKDKAINEDISVFVSTAIR